MATGVAHTGTTSRLIARLLFPSILGQANISDEVNDSPSPEDGCGKHNRRRAEKARPTPPQSQYSTKPVLVTPLIDPIERRQPVVTTVAADAVALAVTALTRYRILRRYPDPDPGSRRCSVFTERFWATVQTRESQAETEALLDPAAMCYVKIPELTPEIPD
jgi:hypothetical protein